MAQTFDFDIGNVVGPPGATGNGIKSIQLLSTSGLVKTYRITMTNDTTFDFSVSDGEDGNGISGASFDQQTNALTITFDDGETFTTPSLKGVQGDPGDDGYSPTVTIETITGGHRVTITDKDHSTGQSFDVMDGEDGASDAGDVTYDPTETYQSGTIGEAVSDITSALSAITTVVEPINYIDISDDTLISQTVDVTKTYNSDGTIQFVFTATANPILLYRLNGLTNGKAYILTFSLVSGSLAATSNQKVGIWTSGMSLHKAIATATKSDNQYTIEFTAESGTLAFMLSLIFSSNTTVLGDFSLVENGAVSKTIVNIDSLTDVPETSLDKDAQAKLNISEIAYTDNNLIDFTNLTHGYISGSDGTVLATGSAYSATDFIPVVSGKFYYFKNVLYGYYAFYSSDDVSGFISGSAYIDGRENWYIKIPDNANYARFTVNETKLDSTWINTINKAPTGENVRVLDENVLANAEYPENPCDYNGNEICIFKKILCIGDSLTQGVCNYYDGTQTVINVAFSDYSYPTFLKALTGRDTTNAGLAGKTIAQWYDAKSGTDYSGHDACIIQLGVNDALGSGWTSAAETAMGNIVSKIKSENNGIKIYIATIMPAFSYSGSAFDAVSAGIRAFVENLNDPTVILLDMAVYAHTKEDVAYNNGHLTAFGYLRLAEDYKAYISKAIASNRPLYRSVQLTGTDYSLY